MITLVLGGARSGKSAIAEAIAARSGVAVTYLATTTVRGDVELADRVARHRARRPENWRTLEVERDLSGVLSASEGVVLVDSLGAWVAGVVPSDGEVAALLDALTARRGDTVVVSDEVGLGVHPSSALGREFRDALGDVNRRVAAISDDVVLVVAGMVLPLVKFDAP